MFEKNKLIRGYINNIKQDELIISSEEQLNAFFYMIGKSLIIDESD